MSKCCLLLQTIYSAIFRHIVDKTLKQKIVSFLKQLGLDQDQANIYLYLQEFGPSSVLAISRGLKTGRTKLYPALEEMVKKQVVAARDRHWGTTYLP